MWHNLRECPPWLPRVEVGGGRRQLGEEWATVAVVVSENTHSRGGYTVCTHRGGGEGGWKGVRGEGVEVVIMSGVW